MDGNQDMETAEETLEELPLDAKIAGWLIFCYAIMILLFGVILTVGLGHLNGYRSRPILFGLLTVTSDLGNGVYALLLGFATLAGGFGLIKGRKYGWWIMFVVSIYCILDGYHVQAIKGVCPTWWGLYVLSAITLWLLLRGKVYGIRFFR